MSDLKGYLTAANTYEIGRPVEILVDGEVVDDIREAHTEEGWAIQLLRDDKGWFYLLPGTDEFATRRLEGKIEVVEIL